MMSMILTINLSLSITFMFMEHPLSMGLILLLQTTIIALITGFMTYNFWFSYILFMIMIGGMLVLFIYMTSVASNEKFKMSNLLSMLVVTMFLMTLLTLMMDQMTPSLMKNTTDMNIINSVSMYTMSMSKYLNFPLNMWMIMLITYLLLALIAVVKITNITYGPLRQKF